MANDDFFKIVYMVLAELYEAMKRGEKVDLQNVSPNRFGIPPQYMADIWSNLSDKGFIEGLTVRTTATGRVLNGLENVKITMDGIEYLQDNSKMRKVYETMKEVRDWIPGI